MDSTGIATDEKSVLEDFKRAFDLNDKVVLEVGGSMPIDVVGDLPVRTWVCVDPLNINNSAGSKYREIQGVAQNIEYPDDSFDYIFSCNAFHLISNFDAMLRELYRVLKDGGYLYAHYGPIWSACDGHQLERVEHQGVEYIFWKTHLIPPWFHLIFDYDELTQILETRLDRPLVKRVVDHVYRGTWVNRLFYEDYIMSLVHSDFTITSISGCDTLDYTPVFPDYDHPLIHDPRTRNIPKTVRQRHGRNKKNILCRDMKGVLRKIK